MIRVAAQILLLPIQENCVKGIQGKDKSRVVRSTEDINMNHLKKACKKYNTTVSIAAQSIIGLTIKEYANRHDDPNLSEITMTSTFATEGFPKSVSSLRLGNTWVPQYMSLPISSDVAANIKNNTAGMKAIIGSSKIHGADWVIAVLLALPYNLAILVFSILTRRITITFSSAKCPAEGYDWGEYHCDAAYGFIPSIGEMMFAISCFSAENTLKLGVITDRVCVKHPDEFIQIMNE
jgi:hypothetical protein